MRGLACALLSCALMQAASAADFTALIAAADVHEARLLAEEDNLAVSAETARQAAAAFYPQLSAQSSSDRGKRRASSDAKTETIEHRIMLSQRILDVKRGYEYSAARYEQSANEYSLRATRQGGVL